MRFTTITIYEEVYPSVISRILAACASPDSWTILGLYVLSSVITIFSYFSTLVDEEYVNNLFERPTGHYIDVRQLNQKNIFISLYAVLLAAKYTTLYLAKRRHVAKITRVQQPLFYEMRGSMRAILYTSAKEALYVFLTTYIIFIIFSGNIYYRVACAVGVFNRVLDSPIVGFRWVDLYLFTRVILSGTITTTLWNFVNRLFDAIFATTIPVTDAYANQFDCLLNGLTKKDDEMIQATAFNELAQLACKNSKKRVELFSCIGKELQQSVWHRIMTACFQVIGELRMSVDTEYKGIQPVEMPSVPIVKSIEQKPRNRLQFSNDSGLYCTPRKHLNELDDRTGMIFGQVNELIESIPSPTNSPIVQQEKNDALAKINKVISILKTVEIKIGCKGYFSKFYEESRVARIQYVFRKHQLIIWAVQILGSLTAASYKEDSYGYVQNDISNVLNQLLGCFEDVEKYVQKETVAIEEIEAVKKALEEAILQIIN
ncbi:hypothetical protein G6F38_005623 [Rhizopus arrhizus]|nr:hypothetical protein G6F38_005623 [Rhizopus arrhizus]